MITFASASAAYPMQARRHAGPRFGQSESLSAQIDSLLGPYSEVTFVNKSPRMGNADANQEVTLRRTRTRQYSVEVRSNGALGKRISYPEADFQAKQADVQRLLDWAKNHGIDKKERDTLPQAPERKS